MNPAVNWFFEKETKWKEEYEIFRTLALATPLAEEIKWGCPCYTLDGANVFLIHGFKDYCALLFMKGALLTDPKGLLIQQTKNVQAARQMRFTSAAEIRKKSREIKRFMKEAIALQKSGAKVEMKTTREFGMPEEFARALKEMKELKKAFERLTPGRQRGYLLYFSAAKQAKTRESRIEKSIDRILEGKGLED